MISILTVRNNRYLELFAESFSDDDVLFEIRSNILLNPLDFSFFAEEHGDCDMTENIYMKNFRKSFS